MIYIFGANDEHNDCVGSGDNFHEALLSWSSCKTQEARYSEFVKYKPLVVDGESLSVSITPKTTYDVVIIRNDD